MYQNRRLYVVFAVVVLTGFLIGAAVPELFRMGTGTYAGFFSLYSLQKFEQQDTDTGRLFWYLAQGRLKTLLFLWMSAYTAAGLCIHLGYLFWLGASAGMLLALFLLRDGGQGAVLFACCLFPQWIVYAQIWKQELHFFAGRWGRSMPEGEYLLLTRRQELKELVILLGLCVLGCAAEAYLGLWTLKIFLNYAA